MPADPVQPDPPDSTFAVSASGAQGVAVGAGVVQNNFFGTVIPASVRWPVLVGRPPLEADAFQIRPGLLSTVEQTINAAVITQVVAGDGGTGKTQLAASVYRRALPDLDLAVWVSATSRSAIVTAYSQVRARLVPGLAARPDAEHDAVEVVNWLSVVTDRRWLVVLDDVQHPADLHGLWPTGPTGRVLVTTRRRDSALLGHGRALVDVGVFTAQEATAFLTRKLAASPARGVLDQAAELGADLGQLPLALAQAGAVILDEGITCAAYRTRLADRAARLADLFADGLVDSGDEYERTVATTWSLAVERADLLTPVGLAHRVLTVAALLDPNGSPEMLYSTPDVLDFLVTAVLDDSGTEPDGGTTDGGPASPTVGGQDARRALRNLHRLSLVTHDLTAIPPTVRMHTLAQRATLERLSESEVAMLVDLVAYALAEIWPDADPDGTIWPILIANATALVEKHQTALLEEDAHPILFRLGASLGESGQIHAAIKHFVWLLAIVSERFGLDHSDTLTTRSHLARWRGEAGDPAGAVAAFQELLADLLRVEGPDHPNTLITRHEIARWRGMAGDHAGAVAAFQQVLAYCLRVLGPDHPDTLTARANLAYSQGQAGNPARAAAAFQDLLTDRLRVLGPDHPATLIARANFARWQGKAGDPASGAAALEDLLKDCLRVLGPDHPNTLITRNLLANLRGDAGNPAGAATAFQELFNDYLRVLGPDHPETLITRANLARWRGQAGNPSGAAAALQELLTDRLRVLGPDHLETLATRNDLARWRGLAGDPAGAAAAFQELLNDYRRVLGPDHPESLIARHNLACSQGYGGNPTGAAAALQELLNDYRRVLGPDHPETLATRHDLAHLLGEAGNPAGATSALQELLNDYRRVLSPDHPETVAARHNLAHWRRRAARRKT